MWHAVWLFALEGYSGVILFPVDFSAVGMATAVALALGEGVGVLHACRCHGKRSSCRLGLLPQSWQDLRCKS